MHRHMIKEKKGLEMVWWVLIVFIIGIVVFLIFFYFIRTGILQIERLSLPIFKSPEQFT